MYLCWVCLRLTDELSEVLSLFELRDSWRGEFQIAEGMDSQVIQFSHDCE